MAQAARLSLRMQKELRLLLGDPPPGVCLPLLSAGSDPSSFSLSHIDAQIKGPDGTVYEAGIFKIKIQIPERYPFQPPMVTFATPIYHPNIDNGGRICLDILNLPPKVLLVGRMENKKAAMRTCSEKARRRATYRKRKDCVKKKTMELATLCDIKACAVIFGPEGDVETWPENPAEVKSILGMLKDCCSKKDFGNIKPTVNEIERETDGAKKDDFDGVISSWEVSLMKNVLDAKLEAVNRRLEKLEKEQEIAVFQGETGQVQEPLWFNFPPQVSPWQQLPALCYPPFENNFGVVHQDLYPQVQPSNFGYVNGMMPSVSLYSLHPSMPEPVYGQAPVWNDQFGLEVGSTSGIADVILEETKFDNNQGGWVEVAGLQEGVDEHSSTFMASLANHLIDFLVTLLRRLKSKQGAWQPSLNISTVLTSIGLLLTEPNPDDGLMCEASKEYKYNRQTFDEKARSMAEKYARSGPCTTSGGSQSIPHNSNPSMVVMEAQGSSLAECEANEHFSSHKKPCGISKKLSLEPLSSNERGNDKKVNEVCIQHHLNTDRGLKQEPKDMLNGCFQNNERLLTRRKLSLESLGLTHTRSGINKENVVQHKCSSSTNSAESLLVQQVGDHHEQQLHQQYCEDKYFRFVNDSKSRSTKKLYRVGQKQSLKLMEIGQRSDDSEENMHAISQPFESHSSMTHGNLPMSKAISHNEMELPVNRSNNGSTNAKRMKLGLAGKKSALGHLGSSRSQEGDNKENVTPLPSSLLSHSKSLSTASLKQLEIADIGDCYERKTGDCDANIAPKKLSGFGRKLPLEPHGHLQGSNDSNIRVHLHSENLSTTPSKSLPVAQQCIFDDKQQHECDEKLASGTKQSREESPVPEAVIVLDSEDSEEERKGTLRSKLSLARKRLRGK
ncbi:hypothetical protein RJ640_024295 [Escallonia rubra]|uniref:UBC core domain-containing protein n=1 Tax=Escallonia rubra TaxID=112253 RepID=A0AA88RGV2_9ASTE|nr:hypothetical protein RJ640_024295 [Escallonia rubra]